MSERRDADAVRRQFLEAKVADLGVPVDLVDRPGTTLGPDADRDGTRRVACYQVGHHAVLSCDPGIVDELGELADPAVTLSDEAFRAWSAARGASILGDAVMRTQRLELPDVPVPGPVHRFDWSRDADRELMQAFIDASDADDLDEAEVAMDDLDDQAVALLDVHGAIVAYASSRPFEDAPEFGDIGVIVGTGARRGGWGRAVVAVLIRDVLEPAGVIPLYRCAKDNAGSFGLSSALGFETVLSLSMAELASDEK